MGLRSKLCPSRSGSALAAVRRRWGLRGRPEQPAVDRTVTGSRCGSADARGRAGRATVWGAAAVAGAADPRGHASEDDRPPALSEQDADAAQVEAAVQFAQPGGERSGAGDGDQRAGRLSGAGVDEDRALFLLARPGAVISTRGSLLWREAEGSWRPFSPGGPPWRRGLGRSMDAVPRSPAGRAVRRRKEAGRVAMCGHKAARSKPPRSRMELRTLRRKSAGGSTTATSHARSVRFRGVGPAL